MENRDDAQFRPAAERAMIIGERLRVAFVALIAAIALAMTGFSAPALAHGKKKHAEQTGQVQQSGNQTAAATGSGMDGMQQNMSAGQGSMDGMMEGMSEDRSKMSFGARLLAWFGRLHPLIVHFPIAFFPAALFTAIVGRRRPAFSAPVQFLVVAGGIFAPLAAAAGWLNGMSAEPDPILAYHRWLGVAIGLCGAGLGVWAWKRPWEDRGAGMIVALTVMTIAIAAQGFMGAALTHGMDHLMF